MIGICTICCILSLSTGVCLRLSRSCELEYNDVYVRGVHDIACNCMPCLWSFLMRLVGYHLIQKKKREIRESLGDQPANVTVLTPTRPKSRTEGLSVRMSHMNALSSF